MRTISQHVQELIAETPFLGEVISEGLGNTTAIARSIHKEVERRMLEKISIPAIAMALHRLPEKKKHTHFGFRFLKRISDITLRSDLTLLFVHNTSGILKRLSAFEQQYPESIQGVTKGLAETLVISRKDAGKALGKAFGKSVSRTQERVTSVTMRLPQESMAVPGVYYPILKALAWEGVNVVEVVSAGTELTLFVEDKNVEKALQVIRTLTRTS